MSLRFSILGFLSTTPASGYDLSRQFSQGVGALWEASASQIYPELRELERLRLIEGELYTADRLNKRIYRLTEEGKRELQQWVEADNEYPPERDAERIRLIFLDKSSRETIRRHLIRHREHYERRLSIWQSQHDGIVDGTHPRLKERLAERSSEEHELIVGLKRVVFEGNMRRAELEIQWANDTLNWLESLGAEKFSHDEPTSVEQPIKRVG